MKILMLGAGVIGTTYAWQLSNIGHNVMLLVCKPNREKTEREDIQIRVKMND